MEETKVKDMIVAFLTFALVIAVLFVAAFASWGICALFVWLISLCFGFEFTWLVATGVWLALLLVSIFLKGNRSNG